MTDKGKIPARWKDDIEWLLSQVRHNEFSHDYVKDEAACETCKRIKRIARQLRCRDWGEKSTTLTTSQLAQATYATFTRSGIKIDLEAYLKSAAGQKFLQQMKG